MIRTALLAGAAWSAFATMAAADGQPPLSPQQTLSTPPISAFSVDDQLWLEVQAEGLLVAESLNAYASRAGVYVPVAELARALDLAVWPLASQQRVEGWVIAPGRHLSIDVATMTAEVEGRTIPLQRGEAVFHDGDVYVRSDLLERFLPLKARADARSQLMTLTFNEPFPVQMRLERDSRRAGLARRAGRGAEPAVEIATPYRLFTPPAFDINVGGQAGRNPDARTRSFDIRAAGDLLYGGLEAYVGSNQRGGIQDVRVSLGRKDADGRALGALGGTRAAIGDVYPPSMAIGAAGYSGRGVFYSTASLDSYDMATPLDLRGELAVGEEVELYVNEVLTGSQAAPIQGRYEFLNVPLTYGINTIRLVFYGAHGQTREQVRRINLGAGQVEAGQAVVRFGAVQQGRALIEPSGFQSDPYAVTGEARLVGTVDYGVTSALTLSTGFAHYTPRNAEARSLGALGVRAAVGPAALRADLAIDDQGGQGLTLGVAGRPLGMGLVATHSEYDGGFADETRRTSLADDLVMRRASDIRLDGLFDGPGSLNIPFVATVRRIEFADDSELTSAELRASVPVGPWYLSNSLAYEDQRHGAVRQRRLVGAADLAAIATARAQLRAGVAYEITPDARVNSAYATADVRLSDDSLLRFGAVRAVDTRQTTLHAAYVRRIRNFDVGVNAAYEAESSEWRLGFQLNFSLGYDAAGGRYRIQPTGAASGGSLALNAWVDENMDGLRQAEEPAAEGVSVSTLAGTQATGANGHAHVGGLGDAGRSYARVDAANLPDPFMAPARGSSFAFTPRPGRTTVIDFPLHHTAEVELTAKLERPNGPPRALAALTLRLEPTGGGEAFSARSDHAGLVYVEGVPPGEYLVKLPPSFEEELGLALAAPVRVIVPVGGGYVRAGDVVVRLTRDLPE